MPYALKMKSDVSSTLRRVEEERKLAVPGVVDPFEGSDPGLLDGGLRQ